MSKLEHFFFLPEYMNVFDLDQIYLVSSAWYDTEMKNNWATFDLLVRDMPKNRNFLVFTGLEEIILKLTNLRFDDKQINLLKKWKLISSNFASYLKSVRFQGDVWAMPEGTIFFPGEPIIRISAPIIQANLLTAFLITSLCSNTIFSSKYVRSVIAAKNLAVIGPASNRAHSFESAFKAQRSAFIAGGHDLPTPIIRDKLGLNVIGGATIAYHAFITSYSSESEAMEAAAKHARVALSLMVDTYNYKQGIKNAIKIIKKYYIKGKKEIKIVVDSGDLYKNTVLVRKELDKAGYPDIKITVASNLDEYKIAKLVKRGIPANTFIVNTEALTSSDDPKLETVYKVAEIIKPNGKIINKMKTSPGKMSLPGRKQVYRRQAGRYWQEDIIGLSRETGLGQSLLKPIIKKGKLVTKLPSVLKIRSYVAEQLKMLPGKYLEIEKNYQYPVKISPELKKLIKETRKQIIC